MGEMNSGDSSNFQSPSSIGMVSSKRKGLLGTLTFWWSKYNTIQVLGSANKSLVAMPNSRLGDDDINDLIESEGMVNQQSRSEMKPLNLDHLSQGELDVPVKRTVSHECGFFKLCCAYIAYMCDYAPNCCWAIGVAALVVPSYFLIVAVFFNPTEHFGIVNDYSEVNSQYDLTLGKIDHWYVICHE